MGISATDYAIRVAKADGDLELIERQGRFGPYVAICDQAGVIEVADNMEAARKRVEECR